MYPPKQYALCLLLLAPFLPLAVSAAEPDDTISTDRPDFVDASDVVGKGRFQIETSFAGDRDNSGGVKTRNYATPTLLRYGVSEDWEVRLGSDGRRRSVSDDPAAGLYSRVDGYGDLALSVKGHLVDANGMLPSLSLGLQWDLDTGSAPFRATGKGASLRLGAEWELPGDLTLGVMPGLASQNNADGRRYTSALFGVVLEKHWSDRFSTFVEYAAPTIARSRDGGSVTTFDIGAAWLLKPLIQLDVALMRGLNRNTPDWSWTLGLSLKF